MSDIALLIENGCIDLGIENDDLKGDDGLTTAVLISAFTDKRVDDDELPVLETDKRGWWGDSFPPEPNDQIGSKLWTLEREKTSNETLRRYEDHLRDCLQWMIEDGVASSIDAIASYDENRELNGIVSIQRPDQTTERFQVLWEKQIVRRV